MRHLLPLAAFALLATTAPALAQDLSCQDFQHNEDGSWSPLKPLSVGGPNGPVKISPAVRFRAGVLFFGVDLGSILDKQCR